MAYTVSSLAYYPLKSCAGISLTTHGQSYPLSETGLLYDRRWMIVNSKTKKMYTQRALPRMALVHPSIDEEQQLLCLRAGGKEFSIPLDLDVVPEETVTVTVWSDEVQAADCGDAVAEFLSIFLEKPVRLVRHLPPSHHIRPIAEDFRPKGLPESFQASFCDGFPFLLISEESLSHLRQKLGDDKLAMKRFRPNIVVKRVSEGALASNQNSSLAYPEDSWKRIEIGGIEFIVVKGCTRCTIPCVNPETGVKESDEPLNTLKNYRTGDSSKPIFGQNLVHTKLGKITVGDTVTVLETQLPFWSKSKAPPEKAESSNPKVNKIISHMPSVSYVVLATIALGAIAWAAARQLRQQK